VTQTERSNLIKLSFHPRQTEAGGGDLMKIQQTAAVIPADSIVKGG
jgi:hypothetical protein